MHIILLIAYGILLSVLIIRIPFVRKSNIKPAYLLIFFWLRCITAWIHNVIAYRYYPGHGDIWSYFEFGKQMKADLLHSPAGFMQQFFQLGKYLQFEGIDLWNEISFRLIAILNVVLNLFSFDNIYINSLLFSFFIFIGSIALYRVFIKAFAAQLLCAYTALLLPSTLFFTACTHKDGVLYLLLGFFLYYWQKQLHNGFTARALITSALLFAGIMMIRINMVFGLLPGIVIWTLAVKTQWKTWVILLTTTLSFLLLAFVAGTVNAAYNFFNIISERQHDFYYMQGKSRIFLPLLQPAAISFLHTLPYAVINGFFQPFPGQGGQPIYTAFSAELLFIWAITLMAIYKIIRARSFEKMPGFGWLCLALFTTQLLLIGYVVPFIGAIIRYRSLFLPFVVALALYYLRHTKLYLKAEQLLKKTNQSCN